MDEAVLYVREVGKRSQKRKKKSSFPTIQRHDVMACIISDVATKKEKALLSKLYHEIILMEAGTMEYIAEIAVSSQEDANMYDLVKRLKREEEKLIKAYLSNRIE